MYGRSFGSGIATVPGPAVLAMLLVAVVLLGAGCSVDVYGETSGSDPAGAETTATRSTARTAGPGTVAMPDPNDLPYITLQHYGAELRGIYCYIHRAGSVGYAII